jgi:hypothetical protein
MQSPSSAFSSKQATGADAPWHDITPEFAAWWWRPQAANSPGAQGRSLLAQRCSPQQRERTRSGFGVVKDWRWSALAVMSPKDRLRSAALYAALLAPQVPALPERLAQLESGDKQWALAIGSIQPLPRLLNWETLANTRTDLLGYAELGFWINAEFPELWTRLLEDLEESSRHEVLEMMQTLPRNDPRIEKRPAGTCERIKRCWALAQNKMESQHGIHSRKTSAS